jgi:Fe-S-cluster containining protein
MDGRTRTFDATRDAFDGGVGAIPCFRCGVCCERWSPLVDRGEAARIAGALGLPIDEFLSEYSDVYPLQEDTHILRHTERGCVFLRYEDDGLATCSIHDVRPEACRAFEASLERRECRDGLGRTGGSALITLEELYGDTGSRREFVAGLGGD